MAFDQTHLDQIDAAILKINSGESIAEVETLGKRVKYTAATIDQLLRYRSFVEQRVLAVSYDGGCFNKVAFNDPS